MIFKDVGTDAEVVVIGEDGLPVSAEKLIKGTKNNQYKLEDTGCSFHNDNVLAEFSTPPCSSFGVLWSKIQTALSYIRFSLGDKYSISIEPHTRFPINEIRSKVAKEYGCSPDINLYDKYHEDHFNPILPDRYCGGHAHVGFSIPPGKERSEVERAIVFSYDVLLGLPSVVLDCADIRRSTYGIAGRYRSKEYGLEYRTLSNFWIRKRKYAKWVFDMLKLGCNNHEYISNTFGKKFLIVQDIINSSDSRRALSFIKKYNLILPSDPVKMSSKFVSTKNMNSVVLEGEI